MSASSAVVLVGFGCSSIYSVSGSIGLGAGNGGASIYGTGFGVASGSLSFAISLLLKFGDNFNIAARGRAG